MTLSDLTLMGGVVYLNIVGDNETQTLTMSAGEAKALYGDLTVLDHQPYQLTGSTPVGAEHPTFTPFIGSRRGKQSQPPAFSGTDIVILRTLV